MDSRMLRASLGRSDVRVSACDSPAATNNCMRKEVTTQNPENHSGIKFIT